MVPMLLRSGHEVIGLDSNLYERCTFEAGGGIARAAERGADRNLAVVKG